MACPLLVLVLLVELLCEPSLCCGRLEERLSREARRESVRASECERLLRKRGGGDRECERPRRKRVRGVLERLCESSPDDEDELRRWR